MSYNFKPMQRDQLFLLPPNLNDWLPSDHLAWFIVDAVDQINLQPFYAAYRADGHGNSAYHPQMMISVLLYAYCIGERSSRRIERLCVENIAVRVLAANRKAESLQAEIKTILQQAAARDAQEDQLEASDQSAAPLPPQLRHRTTRLARLQECQQRLQQQAQQEQQQVQQAYHEKLALRASQEAASGKTTRGRKPKPPPAAAVASEARANPTDPQSRILKNSKGLLQGYNAQALVSVDQIILAADLTTQENDRRQLAPLYRQAQKNLQESGVKGQRIQTVLADGRYQAKEETLQELSREVVLLIPTQNQKRASKEAQDEAAPRGRIPRNLNLRQRMERKLRTQRGRRLYAKRGQSVEPVFGQIKEVRRLRRFSRRGERAVRSEWRLDCAAHNLLKLWRSGKWESRPSR